MKNQSLVNKQYYLTRAQFESRKSAGTLVLGAEYYITDEDYVLTTNIENSLTSTSTTKVLSANQGKILNDRITNLETLGRYLSLWNCTTGLPLTNPETSPYTYVKGDYYRISTVAASGGTNYKPSGTSYTTGVASTTVTTEEVETGDVWFYDGVGNWSLMQSKTGGWVEDVQLNGTSVVNSGIANIPIANNTLGVVRGGTYMEVDNNGYINPVSLNAYRISVRTSQYQRQAVTNEEIDAIVKAALTDGIGTAYTTAEQTAARTRIGAGTPIVLEFLEDDDV